MSTFIDNGALARTDLIFTDVLPISPTGESLGKFFRAFTEWRQTGTFRLIDLKRFQFAGTHSYLVNARSVPKVLAAIKRNVGPDRKPRAQIDRLFAAEIHAGRLTAVCIFPFVSSVSGAPSTITGRLPEGQLYFDRLYERLFFVEADINALMASLRATTPMLQSDPHLDALLAVHRANLTTSF